MMDDIYLRNWYCPSCKEWLTSSDITEGIGLHNEHRKHIKCMCEVKWKEYKINPIAENESKSV